MLLKRTILQSYKEFRNYLTTNSLYACACAKIKLEHCNNLHSIPKNYKFHSHINKNIPIISHLKISTKRRLYYTKIQRWTSLFIQISPNLIFSPIGVEPKKKDTENKDRRTWRRVVQRSLIRVVLSIYKGMSCKRVIPSEPPELHVSSSSSPLRTRHSPTCQSLPQALKSWPSPPLEILSPVVVAYKKSMKSSSLSSYVVVCSQHKKLT